MNPADKFILTINAGSSSLKFALFRRREQLSRILWGRFERIGLPGGELTITNLPTNKTHASSLDIPDHIYTVARIVESLEKTISLEAIMAIGHRVVHGGPHYFKPQKVDDTMLEELRRISPFDPEHMPAEVALIEEFGRRYPKLPQVACFDTAFHRSLPRVAKLLPIPRRYEAQGVQRYGFHGLSYEYLMTELKAIAGPAANGRLILAHLGNGASMAAVRNGQSIDTTMAFTPTAGLVMSSRSGDLDPGLVGYLARNEGMSAEQWLDMVNTKSGLLGISEISSDIRDLLAREEQDSRAAEALGVFCYQAKKWIGAYSAALGGLDTLVFSGGIGENSTPMRARICEGLQYLGIEIDRAFNEGNAPVISRGGAKVTVRLIRTDEELHMARSVSALISNLATLPIPNRNPPVL